MQLEFIHSQYHNDINGYAEKKAFCLLMKTVRLYYLAVCVYVYKDLRRRMQAVSIFTREKHAPPASTFARKKKKKKP